MYICMYIFTTYLGYTVNMSRVLLCVWFVFVCVFSSIYHSSGYVNYHMYLHLERFSSSPRQRFVPKTHWPTYTLPQPLPWTHLFDLVTGAHGFPVHLRLKRFLHNFGHDDDSIGDSTSMTSNIVGWLNVLRLIIQIARVESAQSTHSAELKTKKNTHTRHKHTLVRRLLLLGVQIDPFEGRRK